MRWSNVAKRALQILRRRHYDIDSFSISRSPVETSQTCALLECRGEESGIEQIVKQLAKLVSIRSAEISETRSIVDEAAEVVEGARFQILA